LSTWEYQAKVKKLSDAEVSVTVSRIHSRLATRTMLTLKQLNILQKRKGVLQQSAYTVNPRTFNLAEVIGKF